MGQYKKKFRIYCSTKCLTSDPAIIKKQIITRKNNGFISFGSKEYHEQSLEKIVDKYSTDNEKIQQIINVGQLKTIKNKISNTNLKRYGIKYPLLLDDNKFITWKSHFKNPNNLDESQLLKLYYNLDKKNWLATQLEEKSINQAANNLGLDCLAFKRRLIKLGLASNRIFKSYLEEEMFYFLKSIYEGEIIINSRQIIPPLELDFYLPELNFAIEMNGEYWHSKLDNYYHKNKTNRCNKINIKLLHCWETEWAKGNYFNVIKNAIFKRTKRIGGIFSKQKNI